MPRSLPSSNVFAPTRGTRIWTKENIKNCASIRLFLIPLSHLYPLMSEKHHLPGSRRLFRYMLVCLVGLFCSEEPAHGQAYTITKLKLFPDRDEVRVKDVSVDSLGLIWLLTHGAGYREDGHRSLDVLETIAALPPTDN